MRKTVKEQWIELANIRGWIADQLPAETCREVRDDFFEAQQAIGYAMLHLERVEYRTGGNYSDSEDPVK